MSDGIHYEHRFHVRWSDLDPNWHMRNTSYSEYASNTRVAMLAEQGFPPLRFAELNVAPVLFREDIRYRLEVMFGDEVVVDIARHGLSLDGSHWEVRQRVLRPDGKVAAELFIEGSWLDITRRKLCLPPEALRDILWKLLPTEEFRELPGVIKS